MLGKVKRKAYRVRWADGRAVVCYATRAEARKAARSLGGTITYGQAIGRVRARFVPRRADR